jgi:hypothetical protein
MRAALSGIADASRDVASIVGRHNSGDGLGNRDDDRLRTLAVIWAAGRPAFITDGITLSWPPPQASSVQHRGLSTFPKDNLHYWPAARAERGSSGKRDTPERVKQIAQRKQRQTKNSAA